MKKSILPNLMVILLLISVVTGCEDTHCPAFPEYLMAYIPYTENDILQYMNSSNDTMSIKVLSVWKSPPETYKWNMKHPCGADAVFKTEMNDYFSFEVNGCIIASDSKTSVINFTFMNDKISSDIFEYRVDGIDPFKKENEAVFGDTISMKKDDYHRYNDIVIVRKEGLVSFWDETYNCFWTKIE